jgi:hypothetical protein
MRNYKGLLVGIMAVALVDPSAGKENHGRTGDPPVEARVYDAAQLPPDVILNAEYEASHIFHSARIALVWAAGSPLDAEAREVEYRTAPDAAGAAPLVCGADANVCRLIVRIDPHSPRGLRVGELAEALPFARSGIRARIYYDRVQRLLGRPGNTASAILGHALAHEIGHILLGTNRHSRAGLMQSSWDDESFHLMANALLSFAPDEARSMRERLRTRHDAIASRESHDQVVAVSVPRKRFTNK